MKRVNSAPIGGSGKLSASGIKGERANHHSCRYTAAHVSPAAATIGAGKNSCFRRCKDMLGIHWIDGHIAVDQVLDSLLSPGCSHVSRLIHARITREVGRLRVGGMDGDCPDSTR